MLMFFFYISESNADADVETGNVYREQGDSYKARYYYQSALIKNDNNTDALYQLAKMEFDEENYIDSMKYLNALLKVDGDHSQALILRGTIFIKYKQWNNAILDLKTAEQQDAENVDIQMNLESAYTMKHDTENAEKHAANHERLLKLEKERQTSNLR